MRKRVRVTYLDWDNFGRSLNDAYAKRRARLQKQQVVKKEADTKPAADKKTVTRQTDTKSDTKSDTKKKRRKMNQAAFDCCRIYREQNAKGDRITMKQVVFDYVEDHSGSAEYIYRILNDNPDQWPDR